MEREAANGIRAASVDFVSEDGKSRLSEMDTDLMLASRFQPHLDNRRFGTPFHNVNVGDGEFSGFFLAG